MKLKYLNVISNFKMDLKTGLASLYNEYGRHLYKYTSGKFDLNEDESYEVLYKTLESVSKVIHRYQFESEGHFTNWLLKIHRNNALQLIRSKKSKQEIVFALDDWSNEIAEYEEDFFEVNEFDPIIQRFSNTTDKEEDLTKNNQLFFAMQKALIQIGEQERELLLLRMNNYSYEEIARMLNIESTNLKVRFLRAKAKVEKKTLEILKDSSHEIRR